MLSTTRFRDEDSLRSQCFRRHPDLIIQIEAKDKRTVLRPNPWFPRKRAEGLCALPPKQKAGGVSATRLRGDYVIWFRTSC